MHAISTHVRCYIIPLIVIKLERLIDLDFNFDLLLKVLPALITGLLIPLISKFSTLLKSRTVIESIESGTYLSKKALATLIIVVLVGIGSLVSIYFGTYHENSYRLFLFFTFTICTTLFIFIKKTKWNTILGLIAKFNMLMFIASQCKIKFTIDFPFYFNEQVLIFIIIFSVYLFAAFIGGGLMIEELRSLLKFKKETVYIVYESGEILHVEIQSVTQKGDYIVKIFSSQADKETAKDVHLPSIVWDGVDYEVLINRSLIQKIVYVNDKKRIE
ncbi:hypothetical protein A616_17205 [Brevibacillus brevis X23]|nr:hypothetical protein A616_17205 [Brevibacillus brevis X23]